MYLRSKFLNLVLLILLPLAAACAHKPEKQQYYTAMMAMQGVSELMSSYDICVCNLAGKNKNCTRGSYRAIIDIESNKPAIK